MSKNFSIEFFPPKTDEGAEKLRKVRATLAGLGPKYFSVTYGAGGSTQAGTFDAVAEIQREGIEAAPHLTCIGSTRDSVRELLQRYIELGVKRIVALRGDMPSGTRDPGEFRYAVDLVRFIREQFGDHFLIEVAAYPEIHPQARNADTDIDHFCDKVRAGANTAITQYFFNIDAWLHFRDEVAARGVEVPIIPGIMPINNYSQIARFSDMCGAEIPRWLRKRLEAFGDDVDSIRAYGLDVVRDLSRRLLEADAPGLHFYSMNQIEPTATLWRDLGLPSAK